MIIRVEKHTSRYTVIDNTGLNDSRLGLKARGLLGYLLTKPDNWEVTVAGIVAAGPDGKDSVQAALKELERFGYAEYRTVRAEHGRLGGKKWVIIERPTIEIGQNQPVIDETTFHRQPGFPIIGKTDYRKNRLSENPPQVSTVKEVSTDAEVSTVLRVRGRKNETVLVEEKSVEQPPPIAARPPRAPVVTFSESGWPERGINDWHHHLQLSVPCSLDQARHYFDRCSTWSSTRGSKSSDWIQVAAKFLQEDSKRSPKQMSHYDTPDTRSNQPGIDTVRATQRAARFARRNGLKIGVVD